jgi:serine-type D-Ala-D-Ala carboxypeptidase/endopeptidase (penicillin-binding protein 4)
MTYNRGLKTKSTSDYAKIHKRRTLAAALLFAASLCAGGAVFSQAPAATPQPDQNDAATSATTGNGAAEFSARVDAALSEAHAQKAFWGVLVEDKDTGAVLYQLNADHFFAPASNAKLFVTTFALATLGENYRYRTTLESKARIAANGRLAGDLILVGRGDPDLSNRKFPFDHKAERDGTPERALSELVDVAFAKGLREVTGDIVADDTYYPYDPYPEGWSVGDLFFSFGAPIDAIDYNDNTIGIDVIAGARAGAPVTLGVQPAAAHQDFTAQITTSPAGTMPDLAVVREPGPNFIFLRGTVPVGRTIHLELAMTQPAETAARSLKQLLEARGVKVRGAARALHSPPPVVDATGNPGPPDAAPSSLPDRTVLAEHLSPPLIESIRLTNKISQNLHAEMYLRQIGREQYGTGSTAAGLFVERDFLRTAGIPDGDVVLTDGSGLAPEDLVTPRAVVTLLRYAQTQPWGADFASTLPIAGVDGTLENRFNSGPATGVIHAKTGSIANVRAVSGYATSRLGEPLVFCIFVNANPQHGIDATTTLDAIAAAMIDTLGPAPAAAATPSQ